MPPLTGRSRVGGGGGAVPIVKWNGIEWNWSRSRGVSGGVAVSGREVALATIAVQGKEINVAYFAAHLEPDKANANVELLKHTHTDARTLTQTNTRFLSMLFIIPPIPPRSTPPAIVKNLCCVFHIQLWREGGEETRRGGNVF